jgi:DNA modification methylase
MELQTRKVSDLIPYINNSRTHSEEQINQIISSIKEFGFTNPILLEEENGIIAGHGRLMAVKKMGWTEVPCVTIKGLTKTQIKALNIADNQIALNAGWDLEKLKLEIKGLDEDSFNLDILGFNKSQIDDFLFEEVIGLTDEDSVPEIIEDPKSKLGDIFLLGKHKLMCGSSTDINNLQLLINNNKPDMVFTDPPYGIDYSGGRTQVVETKTYGKILNDTLTGDELGSLIALAFTYIKQDADVYICVSPLKQKPFLDTIEKLDKKIDAVIVWDKKNAGLGYMKYRRQCEFILYVKGGDFKKGDKSDFDLWSISKDKTTDYVHGTQKPVALVERAINNSSKGEDIVLDLFGGSGSTLIACEKLNRINYTMELDPMFCDVIIQRWQNFTGKEAIHEQSGKRYNEL